jgi:hypothetical protein
MAIDYTIDPIAGIVTLLYDAGEPTIGQWVTTMERVMEDPDYRPDYGFLSNLRLATPAPTSVTVRASLEFMRSHEALRYSRWALLVSDSANYGMGPMGQILSDDDPMEFRIFDDIDEAKQWLLETRATGTA